MKINITFPDGKEKTFKVRLDYGMTVEDIADIISESLVREYMKIRKIKHVDRYKDSIKRWLVPKLYSELLESSEKYGKKEKRKS